MFWDSGHVLGQRSCFGTAVMYIDSALVGGFCFYGRIYGFFFSLECAQISGTVIVVCFIRGIQFG
jgi:hypothetical protein